MKKNYPMRVGALLLALTLVTSCFVGGTFAKYVTSGEGKDSARVAKFGVTVTGVGEDANTMFAKKYDADDPSYPSEGGADGNVTVSSDVKVVAPGTKGDMAAFTITGTPEVAVKVTYAAEFDLGDNWIYKENENSDGTFYCPLIITINPKKDTTTADSNSEVVAEGGENPQAESEPQEFCGLKYDSAEAFEKAVNDAIADYSRVYGPNTDLSTMGAQGLAISWSWPFVGDAQDADDDNEGSSVAGQDENDPSATTGVQTDEKDTYLGDQAALATAASNNEIKVSLTVTATVTQID